MPGVDTGVISFFLHPPLGLMTLEHIPSAPFTGPTTVALNRPRGPQNTDAFGILWSVTAEALGVGLIPGLQTEYEERVLEIIVSHQLLDGSFIISQRVVSNLDSGFVLFNEALPYDLNVKIGPPFQVDFSWVLVL
jgi:hypothetical protein